MTLHILNHTDGGKCFFDTDTMEVSRIPEIEENSMDEPKFKSNGHFYDFFDTVEHFLSSNKNMAVIPVFCMSIKKIKKRWKASILSGKKTGEFYNVEFLNGKWSRNEINKMNNSAAYFIFLEKNENAMNDCLILAAVEIKKN